jgi:beta-phosphoglucomutase-like phosphatase (HAD superfamily)
LGDDSPAWFDVIGAGDVVSKKKPSAEIYDWVVKQLGLIPQQCIAIEDSENGLRAACAANITTLITVNDYTCKQNFSGASMVLSDLGEPDQIFSVLGGNKLENSWVNVELLKNLMHRNHSA